MNKQEFIDAYGPVKPGQYPSKFSNQTTNKTYGLKMSQKSLTVPDQSLTMREIMTRFTLGQSLNADFSSQLQYMEEDEIESSLGINIKSLDLSEQHDLKNYWKNKSKENMETTGTPNASDVNTDSSGQINREGEFYTPS